MDYRTQFFFVQCFLFAFLCHHIPLFSTLILITTNCFLDIFYSFHNFVSSLFSSSLRYFSIYVCHSIAFLLFAILIFNFLLLCFLYLITLHFSFRLRVQIAENGGTEGAGVGADGEKKGETGS